MGVNNREKKQRAKGEEVRAGNMSGERATMLRTSRVSILQYSGMTEKYEKYFS